MLQSALLAHLGGYWDGAFHRPACPDFAVTDPATGDALARLPRMGADEARLALDSARRALPRVPSLHQRVAWLRGIADALGRHQDELARVITLENGKPLAEARAEVAYAAGFYRDAAARVPDLAPRPVPGRPGGRDWRVDHRPAGVAGLITPWNFPLAMLAKKLSAALAAGCPSVVKPSELTPLSCIAFFHLLHGLDLDPGRVNLVYGDPPAIGALLCADPDLRVLSFTGSTAVGKLLSAWCAPHVKRLALELGGNAPFLVFPDADLDAATAALMANKFRCTGQTCVCTNRVLVHEGVADALVARLAERVAALRLGHGLAEGTELGPLVDRGAFDKVQALVDDALAQGARAHVGGRAPDPGAGAFFPPTLLSGVHDRMRLSTEEIFGPVVAVSTFATEDEALDRANQGGAGLAAYLFTREPARIERMLAGLRYGHVGVNTAAGPTPEAPFGGMRESGIGREGGLEGVLEYVELQTSTWG